MRQQPSVILQLCNVTWGEWQIIEANGKGSLLYTDNNFQDDFACCLRCSFLPVTGIMPNKTCHSFLRNTLNIVGGERKRERVGVLVYCIYWSLSHVILCILNNNLVPAKKITEKGNTVCVWKTLCPLYVPLLFLHSPQNRSHHMRQTEQQIY